MSMLLVMYIYVEYRKIAMLYVCYVNELRLAGMMSGNAQFLIFIYCRGARPRIL